MVLYISGTGVALTEDADKSLNELIFEAAAAALADAGLTRADIDGVCLGASDQLDGRAISSMLLACPAGGYLREEVKVSDEGSLALATAALRLESGLGRNMLAVSWTKSSESPLEAAVSVNPEPILTRPVGLHPLCVEAAVCAMFADKSHIDFSAIDELARKLAGSVGVHDAPVAWPLRTIHLPPPTDAAIAIVLSTEPSDVELAGWAFESDHHDPTRRSANPEAAVALVAQRATTEAGVDLSDSNVVETTDRNPFRLCMSVTGLGLVDAREAPTALLEGGLPQVNRSGGLWSSNPSAAAGLERVVHAARFVRSGDAEVALAHSSYGVGGQGQFAAVLRGTA